VNEHIQPANKALHGRLSAAPCAALPMPSSKINADIQTTSKK
jgi:hypothetical protein